MPSAPLSRLPALRGRSAPCPGGRLCLPRGLHAASTPHTCCIYNPHLLHLQPTPVTDTCMHAHPLRPRPQPVPYRSRGCKPPTWPSAISGTACTTSSASSARSCWTWAASRRLRTCTKASMTSKVRRLPAHGLSVSLRKPCFVCQH